MASMSFDKFVNSSVLHRIAVVAAIIQLVSLNAAAQKTEKSTTDVLAKAEIVAGNITTAIRTHIADDPEFQISKQLPEDKYAPPKILTKKDGTTIFDRTPGQQARSLMEDIRQGLHALQSSKKALGIDSIALAGGREYWPKLRDISCHDLPGIRYYDLDGFPQFCPD